MKIKVCAVMMAFLVLTACSPSAAKHKGGENASAISKTKKPEALFGELFSSTQAAAIMGEPAHLTDSSTTFGAVIVYRCCYKADSADAKSGKTGAVYFLIERYEDSSAAHKKYIFIKTANQDHGIKTLNDLGDEAYFHSDNENFYFVMVRKGAEVFNLKVNKITEHTSLPEFNRAARQITAALK
jgi:hypothetical protein